MRKSTWRALLILALLVPLSRFSFGDSFAVSGVISDSGDVEYGSITNGGSGLWAGGNENTWGPMNSIWTIGSVEGELITISAVSYADWTFEGITGSMSYGTFSAGGGPCVVEESGCTGPATWTGQVDLENASGTTLFEIQMSGTGTASFGGTYFSDLDALDLISGTADVTGEGEVVYAAPSVPEPSTLTLMMTALIASILAMRFRRTTATQN